MATGEYGVVYKTLWRNRRFIELGEDGQKLLLFLFTGDPSNLIGLFYFHVYNICAEAAFATYDWTPERTSEAFNRILKLGWVKYDSANKILLVRNWFDHRNIISGTQLKKALGQLANLPFTPLLKEAITDLDSKECKLSRGLRQGLRRALKERLERGSTLGSPLASPLASALGSLGENADKNEKLKKDKNSAGTETGNNGEKQANSVAATLSDSKDSSVTRGSRLGSTITETGTETETIKRESDDTTVETVKMDQVREFAKLFNEKCPLHPQVNIEKLSENPTRVKHVKARLESNPETEFWLKVFDEIHASDFLSGGVPGRDGKKPFKVTFDWMINPANLTKIIEGNYRNEESKNGSATAQSGARKRAQAVREKYKQFD